MKKFLLSLLPGLLFYCQVNAQRNQFTINSNWAFHQGDITDFPSNREPTVGWEPVTLPHTWNAADVNDDAPGYYRGISWYRRVLFLPKARPGELHYLFFEGVNQEAQIYVNGHLAGTHAGGYTGFRICIEPFLNVAADSATRNEVLVKVDNSAKEDVPPLSADFTFFGGIYRDVYLLTTHRVHFDLNDYGAEGVKISTPSVNAESATVLITGRVNNQTEASREVAIISSFTDAQGVPLMQLQTKLRIKPGEQLPFTQQKMVDWQHHWSPNDPYLYRVITRIVDAKTGEDLDELTNPLALRWYRFDAERGFFLNGRPLKLIGASRHQDYAGRGNGLPNQLHANDMQLLKDMGGNFVRIAHYPQDPAVLEACDRLGILASVEIPVVNTITVSKAFAANAANMEIEMIRQNFNHPSVIIWGYMNEILLRPKFEKNSVEQLRYIKDVVVLARQLDSLARKEDPQRYTMMACHGDFALYQKAGLLAIPQIVGWNLYQGWYSGGLEGFDQFLDRHHQTFPQTPMIVTEYGADADSRIHSDHPERFDKSVEYQVEYHRHYLEAIRKRPFVAGAAIWNLADFSSESRADATPHVNTKGITTQLRQPKDAYLFYQANLLSQPFLRIGSLNWRLRSGIADSRGTSIQQVSVFSNRPNVKLWLNGQELAVTSTVSGVANFSVPFVAGENKLKATAEGLEDESVVDFTLIPARLDTASKSFSELNVSLGDRRFSIDEQLRQVWLPEQAYQTGGWGYIGGRVFSISGTRQSFGSDKAISGTDLDAVYQTQRIGIQAFRFDVTDGVYDLTLGFAELESANTAPGLIYNLGTADQNARGKSRAFDVWINGRLTLPDISTSNELQPQREYTSTVRLTVEGHQGIFVEFKPREGETTLNAIQLKKVYQ